MTFSKFFLVFTFLLFIACTNNEDDEIIKSFPPSIGSVKINDQIWNASVQSRVDFRDESKISLFFDQNHSNGNLHRRLTIRSIPKTVSTYTIQSTGLGSDTEGVIPAYIVLGEDGVELLEYYLYDPQNSAISQVEITQVDNKECLMEGTFNITLLELETKEKITFSNGQFSVALPE